MTERTTELNELGDRINRLEARIMFQDDTIEKLNQTITAQWREIDALTRQIASIGERLKEAEANAASAPTNETPPHY